MATPDFTVKNRVDPQAFASVLQRRAQIEQQAAQREQEFRLREKESRTNRLLQAIQMGGSIVTNMMAFSKQKQEKEKLDNFAELVGQEFAPMGQSSLINEGQPFGVRPTPIQTRQQKLAESIVKFAPKEAAKQRLKALTGAPSGTPPRTVQGIFVDQFNRGQINEKQLKDKLQTFDPDVTVITDKNTDNTFVYDKRTQTLTPITGQKPAGLEGKKTARQFTPVENRAISSFRQQIGADAVLNADRSSLMKADSTRELIKQNRPGSIGFIQTQLAKAAGEQRITEQDIARFSGSPALHDKAIRAFTAITQGRLDLATKEDYLAMLTVVELASAERLNQQINSFVASAALETEGANLDALKQRIAPGILPFIKKLKDFEKQSTNKLPGIDIDFSAVDEEIKRRGL